MWPLVLTLASLLACDGASSAEPTSTENDPLVEAPAESWAGTYAATAPLDGQQEESFELVIEEGQGRGFLTVKGADRLLLASVRIQARGPRAEVILDRFEMGTAPEIGAPGDVYFVLDRSEGDLSTEWKVLSHGSMEMVSFSRR